jgi:hypothetical protein
MTSLNRKTPAFHTECRSHQLRHKRLTANPIAKMIIDCKTFKVKGLFMNVLEDERKIRRQPYYWGAFVFLGQAD